ncbi:ATP-binding protein [Thiorhodococcus mannitoliphagus]|uniref:ATP-binding protein n=1 Tax=Thiorhodococcus mannitoliphagus TaxID=329406 RepID=A0A6P1E3W7_9GAMM|nr:ATP-binding protein [Thiorhodococcus mannitoliphagus]NEX23212.1 ATP-binding protein [Thiorhodococcus mannitoliphagus]
MTDSRAPLPIGVQTFRQVIESGCAYVDKTAHALDLIERGKAYFLSRPRRFGKSLFVDTLKELFEGSEALFRGLFIHDRWDWSQRHPVIVLDFAAGVVDSRAALDRRIRRLIEGNGERLGIDCDWRDNDIPGCLGDLIRHAHRQSGQRVVVLVDEYDKPILDSIDHPERAAELRERLKNLYSVLKAQDAHLRFVFMTGVTKFSKVSLFSGLNQLNDITLSAQYATLCGYTQHDLETTFAEHLAGVDWDELRAWYNGYAFLGEAVYNPYDILLFIDKDHSYRNYWFETGSPSFLLKLFERKRYFLPNLEQLEVSEEILDSFDVERINPVTLLFQSGYLTITGTHTRIGRLIFRLRLPNQEVRLALNDQFISRYAGIEDQRFRLQEGLYDSLTQGDLEGLVAMIKRVFASIPWRNFTGNALPESEGYYASVLYAFLASLNAEIIPEDITNHGQVDLAVRLAGYTYVMELKLERGAPGPDAAPEERAEQPNPALAQIQTRGYSEKYRGEPGRGLFEVGLVFGGAARNLIQADWRRVA